LYDGYEWNGRRIEVREVGRCLVMLYLGLLLGGNRRKVVREEKRRQIGGGKLITIIHGLYIKYWTMYGGFSLHELHISTFTQDRFAGGPPPPRFAGRPNSRPFTASSFGTAGSNSGFYGPATAANTQPGGGFGTNFSSSNLNVAASAAAVATSEQYDGYGGGNAGYNDFGSGVAMMDYSTSGYNAGYGGPFGGGAAAATAGYDASATGYYGGPANGNGSQIFVRN
ncbi:11872_t:CDS:2, partial [Ambispora leptoticha]